MRTRTTRLASGEREPPRGARGRARAGGRAAAQGAPAGGPLTIAIFAPNAPFEGGDARYAYVQRLAAHIGNVSGTPAKGVAFARAGDFEAAVKKGTMADFAIVDPVYLAVRGGFKVIAQARAAGGPRCRGPSS